MCKAKPVQVKIGRLKFRRNPCSVLVRTRRSSTARNHISKRLIHGYAVCLTAQGFSQRFADMDIFGQQHSTRGSGKPVKQPVLPKPRENSPAVGRNQAARIQIGADTDQSFAFGNGIVRVRKNVFLRRKKRNSHINTLKPDIKTVKTQSDLDDRPA